MQQINFPEDQEKNAAIFSVIEEAKEAVLVFSKGTVKVLWFYVILI